jgi:tripartite-type tricarboxylate transporter receptor subunit TctC
LPVEEALGAPTAKYRAAEFAWIGRMAPAPNVTFIMARAPVKTIAEAFDKVAVLGATGKSATNAVHPAVLNNVLGTKFKIVTGYPGSREITLALERGEVQGACGIGWTGIETMHPDWFAKDTIRVLVQLSNKRHDDLNKRGVPRAADLARTDEDRKTIELVFSQGQFGRPFVMPPGVPADRTAALRKAFVVALNDKGLRAEAAKMQLDVDPLPGDELQTLVANLYATPPHLVERAKQALSPSTAAKP